MKGVIREVAVLGAGNGGCAVAADLTLRGWQVRLHARNPARVHLLKETGIQVSGTRSGVAHPALISDDLEPVVSGADLVMLVVPASAHEAYATALAPLLKLGQLVYLNPGHTGGSLHVRGILRQHGAADVDICESVTLTYICRLQAPAEVVIYGETKNLWFAALPARHTETAFRLMQPLFPNLRPAAHVLETGLMNMNAVMHPVGMLMNAGWIEYTGGDFLFYSQGLTPALARVIEAVDGERMRVAGRLGLKLPSFIDYFREAGLTTEKARESGSVYRAIQESEPNRTIRSPGSLDDRYLEEDVPYGLVPLSELGRALGCPTPTIDALIQLASVAQGRDYRREGLTLARMGLEGLGAKELLAAV